MGDGHFVVVFQFAAGIGCVHLAVPAHAENLQLGRTQRAHARAANHGHALFQRKQHLLVPDRADLFEHAVDDGDAIAAPGLFLHQQVHITHGHGRQEAGTGQQGLCLRQR